MQLRVEFGVQGAPARTPKDATAGGADMVFYVGAPRYTILSVGGSLAMPSVSRLKTRAHAKHLDHSLLLDDLIDRPVLRVDASRTGASQVT